MDALILFSHGSLLCGADTTLREHAARLRARGDFGAVEVGFLNYGVPTFAEAVARCAGADRIIVAPYFLVPGKFVTVDLPRQIEAARAQLPRVTFVVADAIGYHEALADALLDLAAGARPPERWHDHLEHAAEACEGGPECPLHGTDRCPLSEGRGVALAGRSPA